MLEVDSLSLPESHFNILQILSALAWSDGHLSSEEIELLLEEFKQDLPANPAPISSGQELSFSGFDLDANAVMIEQMEERINAELAFQELVKNYPQNPLPLETLVDRLKTHEDRCLTVKLAYMLISIGYDEKQHSIPPTEKAMYRQLIQLLDLDSNLVKEIEWEAAQELEQFQHPFKALMTNLKRFFN